MGTVFTSVLSVFTCDRYVGSNEPAKNTMMDEMDAVATESMCQVGSMSYRAGFAVKLREIQGESVEISADVPRELSPVPASAGQMLHEEGGEESACTEDEVVEPKQKKQKKEKKDKADPKPKPRPKDKKDKTKEEKKAKETQKKGKEKKTKN